MKKHRKQSVNVGGKKRLVDVPVDGELYKADNREEYQRARSKEKHVPLEDVFADLTTDVAEIYEKAQLIAHLREAMLALEIDERHLIELLYFDGLTEREAAVIFKITQQAVSKRKHKIIKKLRGSLIDWIEN